MVCLVIVYYLSLFLCHSASTLSLGHQSGVLIAVPIPEEHAAAGQQIEEAIQAAVREARYTTSLCYCGIQQPSYSHSDNSSSDIKENILFTGLIFFFLSVLFFLLLSSKGVSGRDVTPFILQKVNELTQGRSLQASILLKKTTEICIYIYVCVSVTEKLHSGHVCIKSLNILTYR